MLTNLLSLRQLSHARSRKSVFVPVLMLSMIPLWPGFERMPIERLETSRMSIDFLPVTVAPGLNSEQSIEAYGQLPIAFEANQGQSDEQVRFISRGSGYSLFLTSNEAVLSLRQPATQEGDKTTPPTDATPIRDEALRLSLVGANATPQVAGLEELPGKVNYFIGSDPAKWRTNVPTYAKVKYKNVYPGVDMIYYGNQRQLEYDLIVAPGIDTDVIALRFAGSETLSLNSQGEMMVELAGGKVMMHKPYLYQDINGSRQSVQGGYMLQGQYQVGFQVGDYDTTRPLVIDPVILYSTYLGGIGQDYGTGIAVDGAGSAYVTGQTTSTNFPLVTPPYQANPGGLGDAFVSKLNPAGNALVYSTYLGGSMADSGNGIALDGAGNAYITGQTASTNFPVTANTYQSAYGGGTHDGFVTKLSAAGNVLIYSTYLSGVGDDYGKGIAVDGAGNAYVTGQGDTGFPTLNPYQAAQAGGGDAFVTKLNAAGNALIYSTFLGGQYYDYGAGIAVDGWGNACVTGMAGSPNFPTANAWQPNHGGSIDAFVTKLTASGNALFYSTYLGGNWYDFGRAIAVDGAGNVYATGENGSFNFPTLNPYQTYPGGIYVTKFNLFGNAVYSTTLGSSGGGTGLGIAADSSGNAYVTGQTTQNNFPLVNPYLLSYSGGSDAFVTKFSPAGNILSYSTYLGASGVDSGTGIAVDSAGNAYVTGSTSSANFPTVNPYQVNYAGSTDAFVVKFGPQPPCVAPPNTTMVAWYPFDETVGTTAANLATGNTGTLINSPTHIPGKVSSALRFDGVNDYVESPSTIATNIGPAGSPQTCSGLYSTCRGDLSIDAWLRVPPNPFNSGLSIVDKRSGIIPNLVGYHFFLYDPNNTGLKLGLGLADGTNTNYISTPLPSLSDGNWHHVAVTVSRLSPTGIKWYYDGAPLVQTNNPTNRLGSLVTNSPLRIGTRTAANPLQGWFKGDIDELEIFNRELTPAEVQGIYNAGFYGKCKR